MSLKQELGQYFTTHISLKEKLFNFILNKPKYILEPSIGRGDIVEFILKKDANINFDMYEIDNTIDTIPSIDKSKIIYGDFLEQKIDKLYKTIVGNPPYVRTTKGNLFIDFINKCYNLLDINGELIFIVPADFLKLTSASKILDIMMVNGSFTHIYHPHDEKLFENASIDVCIFRYYKNADIEKKVLYNDKLLHIINNNGMITFNENLINHNTLFKDYFDIYVGLVSGKEEVYKNEIFNNIEVLNGKNKIEKYIYIEKYPSDNDDINNHLLKNKNILINRGIRKFNDNNWFEWGAPRNIKIMQDKKDRKCIYIYNLSRKTEIAFLDKVQYFGGGLIVLIPKRKCKLKKIIKYLNSDDFKHNFTFSGRFKIGHRQISNSHIPNNCL